MMFHCTLEYNAVYELYVLECFTRTAFLQRVHCNLSFTDMYTYPSFLTIFLFSYPKFFLWGIHTNKLKTLWYQFSSIKIHKLDYVSKFIIRRFLNLQINNKRRSNFFINVFKKILKPSTLFSNENQYFSLFSKWKT